VTESQPEIARSGPMVVPKVVAFPIAIALILAFVVLLFPWDSLARRVAWEVSSASGSQVTIRTLAPALTERGPVLRARDVLIEHPAIDRLRLSVLEIAPRNFLQWFQGAPSLRIWTMSELGLIDGVLGFGESTSYVGRLRRIELARLPLRLDTSHIELSGQLDGEADIALDPNGTLRGRMSFESESLSINAILLPEAIPFAKATGSIEILDSGATRIDSLIVEGEHLEGSLSGEIGLVHRSQSPPIDLRIDLRIVDSTLQRLASAAGLPVSASGVLDTRVRGTVEVPDFGINRSQKATRTRSDRKPRRRARP